MIHAVFIDDNKDTHDLAELYGQQAGVAVKTFANGTDALKYLSDTPDQVDVVILDLMMAPLDGLTIAEEIRKNEEIHLITPPIKMAFLTAAEINEPVQRVGERVGLERIYRKPYDYGLLFKDIKGWFEV
jgi:CheY-like chemotaxis protein